MYRITTGRASILDLYLIYQWPEHVSKCLAVPGLGDDLDTAIDLMSETILSITKPVKRI